MLRYESEKRYGGGRLVGRLSPDAYDCKHTVEPSWPDVAMLTSFWIEHPCARTNHTLCLGAGAKSSRFPAIWDAARRNHAASARAWNTTYLVGGGKKETATGAICKKLQWVGEALRRVKEGQWMVFVDADAGFQCNKTNIRELLYTAQAKSWAKQRANPSIIDFHNFGFFALRNDATARGIMSRWNAYLQSHPLLCVLSTVPLQASLQELYGKEIGDATGSNGRCHFVHISETHGVLLHLIGQGAKANVASANTFIARLHQETTCWLGTQ